MLESSKKQPLILELDQLRLFAFNDPYIYKVEKNKWEIIQIKFK